MDENWCHCELNARVPRTRDNTLVPITSTASRSRLSFLRTRDSRPRQLLTLISRSLCEVRLEVPTQKDPPDPPKVGKSLRTSCNNSCVSSYSYWTVSLCQLKTGRVRDGSSVSPCHFPQDHRERKWGMTGTPGPVQ